MSSSDTTALRAVLAALDACGAIELILDQSADAIDVDAPTALESELDEARMAILADHKTVLLALAGTEAPIHITPANLLVALRCQEAGGFSIDAIREADSRVLWRLWNDDSGQIVGVYQSEAAVHAVVEAANAVVACQASTAATRRELVSAVRQLAREASEPDWFRWPYDTWCIDQLIAEARRLARLLGGHVVSQPADQQ